MFIQKSSSINEDIAYKRIDQQIFYNVNGDQFDQIYKIDDICVIFKTTDSKYWSKIVFIVKSEIELINMLLPKKKGLILI